MAGEAGTVGWANGRRNFHFVAGEEQEVERSFEWNHLLRHEHFEGDPILEEVPEDGEGATEAAPNPATDPDAAAADETATKSRKKVS